VFNRCEEGRLVKRVAKFVVPEASGSDMYFFSFPLGLFSSIKALCILWGESLADFLGRNDLAKKVF
jgi:hypothetical protein